MNNKTIIIISLIITLMGILILLILMQIIEPIQLKINQLDDSQLNQKIQLQGQILNIKDYPTFQMIRINDSTGKISLLVNKDSQFNLKENSHIIASGRLTEYKNNLEMQVDTIKIK